MSNFSRRVHPAPKIGAPTPAVDPHDENPSSTGRSQARYASGTLGPGAGRRFGSTPEDRAGKSSTYIPGYGVPSEQNTSVSSDEDWVRAFPNTERIATKGGMMAVPSQTQTPSIAPTAAPVRPMDALPAIRQAAGTGQQVQTPYGPVSSTMPQQDWQQGILKAFPQIGQEGHPANAAFVEAYKQNPDPAKAMEMAQSVMAQQQPKPALNVTANGDGIDPYS